MYCSAVAYLSIVPLAKVLADLRVSPGLKQMMVCARYTFLRDDNGVDAVIKILGLQLKLLCYAKRHFYCRLEHPPTPFFGKLEVSYLFLPVIAVVVD